ncbi:unnamed protein product [Rhodiola kirilowii]
MKPCCDGVYSKFLPVVRGTVVGRGETMTKGPFSVEEKGDIEKNTLGRGILKFWG